MGLVASKTPAAERNSWRTPDNIFAMLDRRHGPFTLDAAADLSNHKCDLWLGPHGALEDALTGSWAINGNTAHRVFCNPPYDQTAAFVQKAYEEVRNRHVRSVTLLVPATTDVKWFHRRVVPLMQPSLADIGKPDWVGVIVEFSEGRIRFERPDGTLAGTPTHGSLFVTFHR